MAKTDALVEEQHPSEAAAEARNKLLWRLFRRPESGVVMAALAIFVFFAIFGGAQFLSLGGTASWLNIAAELAIIALPVGLLMISGEFDLSVGSVVAAS